MDDGMKTPTATVNANHDNTTPLASSIMRGKVELQLNERSSGRGAQGARVAFLANSDTNPQSAEVIRRWKSLLSNAASEKQFDIYIRHYSSSAGKIITHYLNSEFLDM